MRRFQLITCLALALASLVALAPEGSAQRPKPSSQGSSGGSRPSGGGSSRPSSPSPRPSAPSPSPRPSTQPSAPRPSAPSAPRPSYTPSRPTSSQPSYDAPRPSAGASGRPSTSRPPSAPSPSSSSGSSWGRDDRPSASRPSRDSSEPASNGVRYLPRAEDRPTTPAPASSRFPRAAGATPPVERDALPTIGTVEPRRGFPKLLGSTSGETQGMGPSAKRLASARDAAQAASDARRRVPGGSETVPSAPVKGVDAGDLAKRYRRTASRPAADDSTGAADPAGPANGRIPGNEASRVARARAQAAQGAGDTLADPLAPGASDDKQSTLRDRAYANPERTRHHLKQAAGGAGSGASHPSAPGGINYGLGYPSAGGGVGAGCWDDDWSGWIDYCHGGGYPWSWYGGGRWWWHSNWGGCWPWGTSYWWWSAFWYPVFWYGSYSPARVIVYDDPTPTTTVIIESPPAYGAVAEPGEAVLDEDADPNARAVDESMERLLSPAAASASRAATQNLSQGDAAFREGRFGDAVHFYAKAIEFQPEEGVLYLVLSDALFATGDYHYGAYALRKALELDPSLVDNPVDKHGFYADPREFDRQLAVLETYLRDRPTDADARLLLAANYLFGRRPAAAVDLLELHASESVRNSPAGALIYAAAQRDQFGAAQPAPVK